MANINSMFTRSFRIFRNLLIDLRFGKPLGGTFITHRKSTNSDYLVLSKIFDRKIKSTDVLVDIGCGNGRVINYWLQHYPNNQMIGIELHEQIAESTRQRLQKYPNVTIITGDAIQNLPQNGTLFYFYNPFGPEIVRLFKERLKSLFTKEQGVKLLYYNCKYIDIFEDDPAWNVTRFDMGGPQSAPFNELAVIKMI